MPFRDNVLPARRNLSLRIPQLWQSFIHLFVVLASSIHQADERTVFCFERAQRTDACGRRVDAHNRGVGAVRRIPNLVRLYTFGRITARSSLPARSSGAFPAPRATPARPLFVWRYIVPALTKAFLAGKERVSLAALSKFLKGQLRTATETFEVVLRKAKLPLVDALRLSPGITITQGSWVQVA